MVESLINNFMDNLVIHLNDTYTWPSVSQLFPGGYQKNLPAKFFDTSLLDSRFLNMLESVDLKIFNVEAMWKPAGHSVFGKYGLIHVDSKDFESMPKIIRVIDGDQSEMIWYELNEIASPKVHQGSALGRPNVSSLSSFDEVKELHRDKIRFSLVEVGTHMHAIHNPVEDRIAICCRINEKSTGKFINYDSVKQRLQRLYT